MLIRVQISCTRKYFVMNTSYGPYLMRNCIAHVHQAGVLSKSSSNEIFVCAQLRLEVPLMCCGYFLFEGLHTSTYFILKNLYTEKNQIYVHRRKKTFTDLLRNMAKLRNQRSEYDSYTILEQLYPPFSSAPKILFH